MLHELYSHIVWTTRWRAPLINAEAACFLASVLPTIAAAERTTILEIGIVSTHLHLLVRLHPTTSIPRLLQRMKGGTAASTNQQRLTTLELRWAKGYSIHSVGKRALERTAEYVRTQHLHHPHEAIRGSSSLK
ncbi:MAG: IS200/IS605 family transposase [Gemmatimonadales bacterium]|nr:IS200/IS605 family transposase [Gemmatimonadales bacterium]